MGAYIEYAKGGTDLRTKGTISCWVKRSELGREQYVWGWGENNSSDAYLRFDAADNLEMHCDGADGTFNSTRLFRDTNAWYHIVFSLDGANATANLRRRLWVNGVQIDEGKSAISTFSAAVMGWHSTQDLWIGANPRQQQSSGHAYFNGLISHFHYCSNNSYAASDFGETDSVTGEWKIKTNPSVNYGSEGFFLKMENSANMDLDSSSNNKTLTTTGTVTATIDNPSNIFATMNPLGTYDGTLANGNTQVQTNQTNYRYIASSLGVNKGKYYWEVKLETLANYMICGITDQPSWTQASADSVVMLGNGTYDCAIYTGDQSAGGGNGHLYHSSTSNASNTNTPGAHMSALGNGNILTFALDLDSPTKKLYIGENGNWANGSGSTNQSFASASGISIVVPQNTNTGHYFPACGDYSGTNGVWQYNFGNGYFGTTAVSSAGTNASGNGIFEYDVPAGYTALCTKGINSF